MRTLSHRGSITCTALIALPILCILFIGLTFRAHQRDATKKVEAERKAAASRSVHQAKLEDKDLLPWEFESDTEAREISGPMAIDNVVFGSNRKALIEQFGEAFEYPDEIKRNAPIYPLHLKSQDFKPAVDIERKTGRMVRLKGRNLTIAQQSVIRETQGLKDPRAMLGQEKYRLTLQQREGRQYFLSPTYYLFYPRPEALLICQHATSYTGYQLIVADLAKSDALEPEQAFQSDGVELGFSKEQLLEIKGEPDRNEDGILHFQETRVLLRDERVVAVEGSVLQQKNTELLRLGAASDAIRDFLPLDSKSLGGTASLDNCRWKFSNSHGNCVLEFDQGKNSRILLARHQVTSADLSLFQSDM